MSNKIYPVCVIGGGSAGVMASCELSSIMMSVYFFQGHLETRKGLRAFWVSKIENMPSHFTFKKGIEDPNKEVISWIQESSFSNNLFFKKNEGVENITKNSNGFFEITSNKGEVYHSRFVVLCTGVMDVQPEINGDIAPILALRECSTCRLLLAL